MIDESSYERVSISSSESWDVLSNSSSENESNELHRRLEVDTIKLCAGCGSEVNNKYFKCTYCSNCVVCLACQLRWMDTKKSGCSHNVSWPNELKGSEFPDEIRQSAHCNNSSNSPRSSSCMPNPLEGNAGSNIDEVDEIQPQDEQNVSTISTSMLKTTKTTLDSLVRALQSDSPPLTVPGFAGTTVLNDLSTQPCPNGGNSSARGDANILAHSWLNVCSVMNSGQKYPNGIGGINRGNVSGSINSVTTSITPSIKSPLNTKIKINSSHSPKTFNKGSISEVSCAISSTTSSLSATTQFLKSVVKYSTAALNNFDLVPIEVSDYMWIPPKFTPPLQCKLSFPTPPLPVNTDSNYDIHHQDRCDGERLRQIIQPKPLPKSISETISYNLR